MDVGGKFIDSEIVDARNLLFSGIERGDMLLGTVKFK